MNRLRRGLSLLLLGVAITLAAQPLLDPKTRWFVEVSAEKFRDRVTSEISKVATPEWTARRITALLQEEPRDWAQIDRLSESTSLSEALQLEMNAARARDFTLTSRLSRCGTCIWDATTCSVPTLLSCRLPVDLTVVGDVTALARGGVALSTGDDVDEIDVALGAVGLTATALIPLTGGASAPVKIGASTLRSAKTAGRLSPRLLDAIRAADATQIRRFAAQLGELNQKVGLEDTLRLLPRLERLDDAADLNRTVQALGPETLRAFDVLGDARVARLGLRLSEAAWQIYAAVSLTVGAMISLFYSALLNTTRRLLR
jgi:hypothetical protein